MFTWRFVLWTLLRWFCTGSSKCQMVGMLYAYISVSQPFLVRGTLGLLKDNLAAPLVAFY